MKKKKTSTSGEVTSTDQKWKPVIGPRCQRAVIACPAAAITARPAANEMQKARGTDAEKTGSPAANEIQKPSATRSSPSRSRIAKAPTTITASASTSQSDI